MGRIYTFQSPIFTPGAARTVIEAIAVAQKAFRVRRVWMSSADTAGATVVEVRIQRLTATGAGSALTAGTHANQHNENDTAPSTTMAKYNNTAEPTKGTAVLRRDYWNIQVPYEIVLGPGEEWEVKATDAGVSTPGIGIELMANPGASMLVGMEIEEL